MGTIKRQYAVITHATSVLGRAYALELAKREINLVLISSSDEELENTASNLKEFGIDVRFYETDLSSHQNLSEVVQWINLNFEVALVININHTRPPVSKIIHPTGMNYFNTNSQLNVMSVSLLTRALLPNLMRQRKSYILNVSDISVFTSVPFRIKDQSLLTFINHFTRALCRELKDTNVFVTQIYVNATQGSIDLSDRASRILPMLRLPTPERIAATSVHRLFRRETSIIRSIGYCGIGRFVVWFYTIWTQLCLLATVVKRVANRDSSFDWLRKN